MAELLAEIVRGSEGFVDGDWSIDEVHHKEGATRFVVTATRGVEDAEQEEVRFCVRVLMLGADE